MRRRSRAARRASVGIASLAFAAGLLATSDVAPAQSAADRAEAAERGYDGSLETDRFAVFWRTSDGNEEEVHQILGTLDGFFDGIAQLVGPDRTPQERIVVVLGGHGQGPDGRWRFPNVDRRGRVTLYHYSDEFTDHTVEAAHELVHAFRRAAGVWHSGFWEEGFAEAIAMAVDPGDVGFPRYGYPLTVTAGHLLAWDEYIPLAEVRSRHREVGRRCQLQAYLERASFFQYLVDREGLEAFIELSYGPRNPIDDDYRGVYGMTFDELVADWESVLRSDYEATADADEMARRYREEPPIRGRPICSGAETG